MKFLIILVTLFTSFSVLSTEVDVISAEYGILDHRQNKSLCLTSIRVPETGELLGLVESIEDCFYARIAKKSRNNRIDVDLKSLRPLEVTELERHLQTIDTQLKFLFSYGE